MNLLETYYTTQNKSDKESFHRYISNFYCDKLTPRKSDALNILEIGIFKGDSLKLWEDFFPNTNIYGIDIIDDTNYIYSNRVKKYILNAYDQNAINFIKNLNIKFDIIIDDGPHTCKSQDYICKNYKQFLNKDGLLIIEDVVLQNVNYLQKNNPDFKILNLLHVATCFMDNIILYTEK